MPLGIGSAIAKLRSLKDVDVTGITDGETLVWNSTDSKFEPGSGGGGGGGSLEVAVYRGVSGSVSSGQVDLDWSGSFSVVTTSSISVDGSGVFTLAAGKYRFEVQGFLSTSDITSESRIVLAGIEDSNQSVVNTFSDSSQNIVCGFTIDSRPILSTARKLQILNSSSDGAAQSLTVVVTKYA